jgi:hypothetical protein
MKQQAHYINITESRRCHINCDGTVSLKLSRQACIQRSGDGNHSCRLYDGISEASILRLAKIQEKLAK